MQPNNLSPTNQPLPPSYLAVLAQPEYNIDSRHPRIPNYSSIIRSPPPSYYDSITQPQPILLDPSPKKNHSRQPYTSITQSDTPTIRPSTRTTNYTLEKVSLPQTTYHY